MDAVSCKRKAVANKKRAIRRCYRKYHILIEMKLHRMKSPGFILSVELNDKRLTCAAAKEIAHILYVKYRSFGFDVSIQDDGPYICVIITLPKVKVDL